MQYTYYYKFKTITYNKIIYEVKYLQYCDVTFWPSLFLIIVNKTFHCKNYSKKKIKNGDELKLKNLPFYLCQKIMKQYHYYHEVH